MLIMGKGDISGDPDETVQDVSWNHFTQKTTFHGVRYIFDPTPSKLRRILWVLCVLVAIGLFFGQVFSRTMDFFEHKSYVSVEVKYPDQSIPFPAVTICNQNTYRMTSTIQRKLYHFIDEAFSDFNTSDIDYDQYPLEGVDAKTFLIETAHQIEDLVDSCLWEGKPCDMKDFKGVFTDLGVCYTFNSNPDKPLMVSEAGSKHGLVLVMNVEQYEYMRGPQNDAGISILLHNQTEVPMMKDVGFSVAPGMHSTVGIKRFEQYSLEEPYGSCIKDAVPMSVCMSDCRNKKISKVCKCIDNPKYNVTKRNNESVLPFCTMEKLFSCVKDESDKITSGDNHCYCKIPCQQVKYRPNLSYAQLSKFNIERIVLKDQKKKKEVQRKFLNAREMGQAYLQEYYVLDQEQADSFLSAIDNVTRVLHTYSEDFSSSQAFTEKFETIDILYDMGNIMKNDNNIHVFIIERLNMISKLQDHFELSVSIEDSLLLNDSALLKNFEMFFIRDFLMMVYTNQNTSDLYNKMEYCMTLPGLDPKTTNLTSSDMCWNGIVNNDTKRLLHSYIQLDFVSVLGRLQNAYKKAIEIIYTNSTQNVSEKHPEHDVCLLTLKKLSSNSMVGDIAEIQNLMKNWSKVFDENSKNETLKQTADIISTTRSENIKEVFENIELLYSNCEWMSRLSCQGVYCETIENEKFKDIIELISCDDMGGMLLDLKGHYLGMASIWNKLKTLQVETLEPLKINLKRFKEGNITKNKLATLIESPAVAKPLEQFFENSIEFSRYAFEYNIKITEIEAAVLTNYNNYFQTELPWINTLIIEKFQLVKTLRTVQMQRDLNEKLNQSLALLHDDLKENIEGLVEGVFEPWKHLAPIAKMELTHVIEKTLFNALQDMDENLQDYKSGNQMNYKFFLDNFMQVDIFYQELSYEKLEQHITFKLLSLFSEIGGFLGLLLGASVLTVCELVDYLVLLFGKHVKKSTENVNVSLKRASIKKTLP